MLRVAAVAAVVAAGQAYPPCPLQQAPQNVPKYPQRIPQFDWTHEKEIPSSFLPKCDCDCCATQSVPCSKTGEAQCMTQKTTKCNTWLDTNFLPINCNVEAMWSAYGKKPVGRKDMPHNEFCSTFCYSPTGVAEGECKFRANPNGPTPGVAGSGAEDTSKGCPCERTYVLTAPADDDPDKVREKLFDAVKADFTLLLPVRLGDKTFPAGAQLDTTKGALKGSTSRDDLTMLPKGATLIFRMPMTTMLTGLRSRVQRGQIQKHQCSC